MSKNETVFQNLERLKAEMVKLQEIQGRAQITLDKVDTSNHMALNQAKVFLKRVNRSILDLELQIKTAEIGIATVKGLAKGCTTASGKRIRV